VILDKLLRDCDIETAFVLIREKKGKDAGTRIHELFDDVIFEPLWTKKSDFMKKIVAVYGECGKADLGLSAPDRTMLIDQVNVIIQWPPTL
jgi:fatty acyl-CoA reductase